MVGVDWKKLIPLTCVLIKRMQFHVTAVLYFTQLIYTFLRKRKKKMLSTMLKKWQTKIFLRKPLACLNVGNLCEQESKFSTCLAVTCIAFKCLKDMCVLLKSRANWQFEINKINSLRRRVTNKRRVTYNEGRFTIFRLYCRSHSHIVGSKQVDSLIYCIWRLIRRIHKR